jgi:hypothetical protein
MCGDAGYQTAKAIENFDVGYLRFVGGKVL